MGGRTRVWLLLGLALAVMAIVQASSTRFTKEEWEAFLDAQAERRDPRAFKLPAPPQDDYPFPLAGTQINSKCFVSDSQSVCSPEFVVVGSMKCGTTSLYGYLLEHPQVLPLRKQPPQPPVVPSKPSANQPNIRPPVALGDKEVRFFLHQKYNPTVQALGVAKALEIYQQVFLPVNPVLTNSTEEDIEKQSITGEASPMYVSHPDVAQRIYRLLPATKIIFMLRNPIDRAYSEFYFKKALSTIAPRTNRPEMMNPNNQLHDPEQNVDTAGGIPGQIDSSSSNIPAQHLTSKEAQERADQERFRSCFEQERTAIESCNPLQWNATYDFHVRENNSIQPPELFECMNRYRAPPEDSKKRVSCPMGMLRNGLYALQVRQFMQYYPMDQILIIRSEDFYRDTANVMKRVQQFLKLSDFDWEKVTNKAYNIINPKSAAASTATFSSDSKGLVMGEQELSSISSYPPMDPDTRKVMNEFFYPYNVQLAQLLNKGVMWSRNSANGE